MRGFFVIAMGLLVTSCHHRLPAMSDADFGQFRAANPGMTRQCLDEVRYGGVAAWRPDDADCFEMVSAQRWSGLWNSGWEWTNFCPEPVKDCPISSEHGDVWLTFAKGVREPDVPKGVYRIEFMGRRSKVAGSFGHQGQYDHLMVVDRVISISKQAQTRGE